MPTSPTVGATIGRKFASGHSLDFFRDEYLLPMTMAQIKIESVHRYGNRANTGEVARTGSSLVAFFQKCAKVHALIALISAWRCGNNGEYGRCCQNQKIASGNVF